MIPRPLWLCALVESRVVKTVPIVILGLLIAALAWYLVSWARFGRAASQMFGWISSRS